MNQMHTLIKAALITGFISLLGLCYMVYYFAASPGSPVATPQISAKQSAPAQAIESQPILPSVPPPPVAVVRRTAYAVPGYSSLKQVTLRFPAIKKEAEEKARRDAEALKKLEEQERKLFQLEVAPPQHQHQTEEADPPAAKVNQPLPVAPVPAEQRQSKPVISPEMERKILQENNQPQQDRKQQVIQSGGRLPVREMQQRFNGILSNRQLENVLDDIFEEKGEKGSYATCVHIKALPETEVTAGQLSRFLIGKGFTMAGRSEAEPAAKGLSVDASGTCIVVTIGKI